LAFARFVTPSYFDVMGVPILQGRDHDRRDVDNSLPPVVVNQALAEVLFPQEDPIGRRLSVNFIMAEVREYEIVGVARNMRITAVNRTPGLQMYFGFDEIHPIPSHSRQLMVRTQGDMASLIPAIRRKVRERDPDATLTDVSTMNGRRPCLPDREPGAGSGHGAVCRHGSPPLHDRPLRGSSYYVSRRTREIGSPNPGRPESEIDCPLNPP
jgi:hypothetical protein